MKGLLLTLLAAATTVSVGYAQQTTFDRLPQDIFDVVPPSARVNGAPGTMAIQSTSCRTLPTEGTRRRIVDVAVQEWAFFGFNVVDQTAIETVDRSVPRSRRRWRRLSPEESARVASSIAGYWTVTPEGGWILDAQNAAWTGTNGIGARWRYPWSAAFVSWVMCESGLGDATRFQRAVAHHVYIDQAIRSRSARVPSATFAAYDIGESDITPGDLLCSARRPAYRSIAERRSQLGQGARTHCDIVVKVDPSHNRILAIGGNVRASVSLKLLPAARGPCGYLRPIAGARRMFAHLKLVAGPIEPIEKDALDRTPTIRALSCGTRSQPPARLVDAVDANVANLLSGGPNPTRC